MQIFFVFSILIMSLFFFGDTLDNNVMRAQKIATYKNMNSRFEITKSVSSRVRVAYDLGRVATSGCPTGTQEVTGLNTGGLKFCWTNISASAGGATCFSTDTGDMMDNMICFATDQTSIAKKDDSNKDLNYASLIKTIFVKQAFASNFTVDYPLTPITTYPKGVYTGLAAYTSPITSTVGGAISTNNAGAEVRLPTANPAGEINTNHVDCSEAHTACITFVLCTNGQSTCTGRRRLAQTFAVRSY